MIKRQIILASTNKTKIERLTWVIKGLGLSPLFPQNFTIEPILEETGTTHSENAEIKANAWSQATDYLSLATDGGLFIPILGSSWQSINTKRFAGPNATDQDRIDQLLKLMEPYSLKNRQAFWIEALSLSWKGRNLETWEVHGERGILRKSVPKQAPQDTFWVNTLWNLSNPKPIKSTKVTTDDTFDSHWVQLKDHFHEFYSNMASLPGEK